MPVKSKRQPVDDVIVIGCGAMGGSSAWQLAKRGLKVRVFEQFSVGHDLGSSHGYSRVIRRAYYEHPDYVPLVDRAYELWRELEAESNEKLLHITGIIEIGSPAGGLIKGSALSCETHKIPHERLSADEITKRFPQFNLRDWMQGIWQKDGGILAVERCILTFCQEARKHGAIIHEQEGVTKIEPDRSGVTIRTENGSYRAKKVVIGAGPWSAFVLHELQIPLQITRQAMAWYHCRTEEYKIGRFPVFLMELPGHDFYGMPIFGPDGIKLARHHAGRIANHPLGVDRQFNDDDDDILDDFRHSYFTGVDGPLILGKICLYTNTPDMHFILDKHPKHPNIAIAAGFSGHGFKFSTVVGEIMADFVEHGKTQHPIGLFNIGRFR